MGWWRDGGRDGVMVGQDGGRSLVPAESVREVLRLGNLTPVPLAPPAICGLTQVRGQIVTIVDPAALRHGRRTRPRSGDPLVLVEAAGVRAALRVDRIVE